jgi:hypothetical protein
MRDDIGAISRISGTGHHLYLTPILAEVPPPVPPVLQHRSSREIPVFYYYQNQRRTRDLMSLKQHLLAC